MANSTKNYGLEQPLPEEFYDVGIQNANMEKIDATLKAVDLRSADVKEVPVDVDRFALVDSADGNKIKLTTWGKIRIALGKVFAALVHTHPMEQITGLIAALSNKVNLSDEYYYSFRGGKQLSAESDLNTLPCGIAFCRSGEITSTLKHAPPGLLSASCVIITESGNGTYTPDTPCFRIQTIHSRYKSQIFRRFSEALTDGIETWREWTEYATKTPPKWYELPLETGWGWILQVKYGIDGTGKGYLVGVVKKASVPLPSEAILRLPDGYRPPIMWPVTFTGHCGAGSGSAWSTYGYIHTDGYLKFNGGQVPSNYAVNQGIAFVAEFPIA